MEKWGTQISPAIWQFSSCACCPRRDVCICDFLLWNCLAVHASNVQWRMRWLQTVRLTFVVNNITLLKTKPKIKERRKFSLRKNIIFLSLENYLFLFSSFVFFWLFSPAQWPVQRAIRFLKLSVCPCVFCTRIWAWTEIYSVVINTHRWKHTDTYCVTTCNWVMLHVKVFIIPTWTWKLLMFLVLLLT